MQSRHHDILFGLLSTKLGLATPRQIMDAHPFQPASAANVAVESQGLASSMVANGTLDEKQRSMIEHMARGALRVNDGDLARTIDTLGGNLALAQTFAGTVALGDNGHVHTGIQPQQLDEDPLAVTQEHAGRYEFERSELGRGGIGRVLVANDSHLGRRVAVKEILPDKQVSLDAVSHGSLSTHAVRFLREARVTGQLEHPNIIPVYELGSRKDGTIYYTMKIVHGHTLQEALAACRDLPARLALLPHFVDMCQALAYAHSRGVVHRDIKPGNIMVGEFGETVVLDWGLAKVSGTRDLGAREVKQTAEGFAHLMADATQAGEMLGTPLYMSPEQVAGDVDNIDAASDVWSLGAVLYEILTGERAFAASNIFEVLHRVGTSAYRPVCDVEPQAPRELAAVVERALQATPADRYRTARELAEDVSAYLTGGRVQAYRYGFGDLIKRFARKHKALLAVSAIAIMLLAGLAVSSYLTIREQRDRATVAHQRAENLVRFLLVDMRDKLEALGRLDLLDDVANKVQEHYGDAASGDASAQYDRARSFDLLGDIHRARGQLTEAEKAYVTARRALVDLVADTDSDAYRRALGNVHRHLGRVYSARGDLDGADEAHRAALSVQQALTERDPERGDWQLDRSRTHMDIADVYLSRGDLSAAEREYRTALPILQMLTARDDANSEWSFHLAAAHEALGDAVKQQGRLADAEASYRAALSIRTQLADKDATNSRWTRELASLHERLGEVFVSQTALANARGSFETAMGLTRELTEREPANMLWQRDLAVRYERLGDIEFRLENWAAARQAFGHSLALMQRLTQVDPSNLAWRRDLVVSYNYVAEMDAQKGALEQAESGYLAALTLMRELVDKAPDNVRWRRDLAIGYNRIGDMKRRRGDWREAERAYRSALDITASLARADERNVSWQRDIAVSNTLLAGVAEKRSERETALEHYRAAHAILKRLSGLDASNKQLQRDLQTVVARMKALGNVTAGKRIPKRELRQTSRKRRKKGAKPKPRRRLRQTNAPKGPAKKSDAMLDE